jgi:hypothetical protein
MNIVHLDDWVVEIRREVALLAGTPFTDDTGGEWITCRLFTGPDAKLNAMRLVARMRNYMGHSVQARSGAMIRQDRIDRGWSDPNKPAPLL